MKKREDAAMPSATDGRFNSLKTFPESVLRSAFMDGMPIHFQTRTIAATGTTEKKAQRQPTKAPRKLPTGAARTEASALPPFTIARARGTWRLETRRIAVAADIDQKPPTATPMSARPTMKMA